MWVIFVITYAYCSKDLNDILLSTLLFSITLLLVFMIYPRLFSYHVKRDMPARCRWAYYVLYVICFLLTCFVLYAPTLIWKLIVALAAMLSAVLLRCLYQKNKDAKLI